MSRKKSKYRPRAMLADPSGWVMAGVQLVISRQSDYLRMMVRNHDALHTLSAGNAPQPAVDVLIQALNMAEALVSLGVGQDYASAVQEGQDALFRLATRGLDNGQQFNLAHEEDEPLRFAMDVHDAQLACCTVVQLDTALALVRKTLKTKKSRKIQPTHSAGVPRLELDKLN